MRIWGSEVTDCQDCGANPARYYKECMSEAVNDAIVRTKPYERASAWREVAADFKKRAADAYLAKRETEAKMFRDLADDATKKAEVASAEGRAAGPQLKSET